MKRSPWVPPCVVGLLMLSVLVYVWGMVTLGYAAMMALGGLIVVLFVKPWK